MILTATWLWAAIEPFNRRDWLLENLLVFLTFSLLAATYKRFRFSMPSYWLFTLFMCLHLYGSHYTYSETPVGYWLQTTFQHNRNHYDRIVHFLFGLFTAYPFMELIARQTRLRNTWLYLFTLSTILSMSACYELLEMLTAVIVSPELGSAFLGTQGDEWDAQKDTGLAFLGALAVVALVTSKILQPNWLKAPTTNGARSV